MEHGNDAIGRTKSAPCWGMVEIFINIGSTLILNWKESESFSREQHKLQRARDNFEIQFKGYLEFFVSILYSFRRI